MEGLRAIQPLGQAKHELAMSVRQVQAELCDELIRGSKLGEHKAANSELSKREHSNPELGDADNAAADLSNGDDAARDNGCSVRPKLERDVNKGKPGY